MRKDKLDEFYGKLKDPYHGRPIVILPDAPIGVTFTISNTKTGEVTNFVKSNDNQWAVYGTDREVRVFDDRKAENLVTDHMIIAARQKGHVIVNDPATAITWRGGVSIDEYV